MRAERCAPWYSWPGAQGYGITSLLGLTLTVGHGNGHAAPNVTAVGSIGRLHAHPLGHAACCSASTTSLTTSTTPWSRTLRTATTQATRRPRLSLRLSHVSA